MKRKSIILFFILTLFSVNLISQSVYVPFQHEVYDFLKKMESRQLLRNLKDAAKPFSRMQISEALIELEKKADNMTEVERETFEFLKAEFKYEILEILGDADPSETRWHVFSQKLNGGVINLDIDYGASYSFSESRSTYDRSQGIKAYGYVYDKVGFYINIVDNLEKGKNLDLAKLNSEDLAKCSWLSPAEMDYYNRIKTSSRGVVVSQINGNDQFQYDEIDAVLSWKIGDFTFSLEKMNNIWGYGKRGSVILSDNTPSYPQIKMRVPLSKDIDFVYFHGELNSNVIDSARSYTVNIPDYIKNRRVDHIKYIAAHQLEVSIWDGVDLSIGESVIYSDRGPLLIYLIPVMFFKAAEHYNGDKDNCQIFGSLDLNIIKNVNTYLTLFIDEINTDKLFDPNLSHRQVAFTSGIQIFEVPAKNFDFALEYTRLNPAVYNHNIPSNTFQNNGFNLGNWMGQNSDNLYMRLGFTPMHALKLAAYGEIFRKGGALSIIDQYDNRQGDWKFLFGPFHIERSIGIDAQYQPLRDVFVNFESRLRKIEDEAYPEINKSNQFEFRIRARLGLW